MHNKVTDPLEHIPNVNINKGKISAESNPDFKITGVIDTDLPHAAPIDKHDLINHAITCRKHPLHLLPSILTCVRVSNQVSRAGHHHDPHLVDRCADVVVTYEEGGPALVVLPIYRSDEHDPGHGLSKPHPDH